MAAIFTPGLKVLERTVVLKDRRLPLKGSVLVKVGDRVKADDIVARTELPGKIYPVNVANQLGVGAGRLKACMRKRVGQRVSEGEVIAGTPGIFGFFKSESRSIITGSIESISTVTGEVIFQADPIPVEIDAYINGHLVDIHPDEGCVVQATATLVQGIFGLGGEVKGELVMGVDKPTDVLKAKHLRADMAGKIVVGGAYLTLEAFKKAIHLKIGGLVTGGFDYDDIKEILGYEVGVAITGSEELGLSLVVTEGFGEIQMAPATFALLKKHSSRRASINGSTQIRAGVIRPEVVVTDDSTEAPKTRWEPPEPKGIELGDQVRGIRAPYFGQIGHVKGLPVELATLESETKVRIMEVQFENGDVAVIPRANVESIEQ
jgi:hypothetical protein